MTIDKFSYEKNSNHKWIEPNHQRSRFVNAFYFSQTTVSNIKTNFEIRFYNN